ncbi:MAG: inositol-3-phosphate synthase [Bacteroidetes bacterium GWE2_42_24]|nr:MAG: inositol-3-phosphate synthase [Bacteroidetes bacterium GWE2_42_24]OFY30571.1 MAG: inositol-3-phosphate synthase [Bacteroidetes bacterium GWF2_43_11]PKP27576.1 MAG: inositol-3-phosphate synthase [Bacteroidetes bacterium HGW-Bacteroidetes-22]
MNPKISKPTGKLGVLIVGMNGAVATTFLSGTMAVRKGKGVPVGSLTQMATIRIGKRADNNFPKIKDFLPLYDLKNMVFGGWDIREENAYTAAKIAEVLNDKDLDNVREELESLVPMKAVFDQNFVKRLSGTWTKEASTKMELVEMLRKDIRDFKAKNNLADLVTIWCGSTEVFIPMEEVHSSIEKFEEGLLNNHPSISPSMMYAWATLKENVPFINGAPNLTVDMGAIFELAEKMHLPIAGKDFKTGQTMVKTVIAPMLKVRMLGLDGWFSTNILGNRDGEVLDDPGSFKTKEESKLSVIDSILQPKLYPELYKDYYHKVRINYYPPRKDNKEGWDNIDIFGWLGYPMQIKIDFLCRDSILAAPIVLDLVLLMNLSQRVGFYGIQDWLSFYFKSPMHSPNVVPEHDLFIQHVKLKNTMREIMNEEPVTHLDEKSKIDR